MIHRSALGTDFYELTMAQGYFLRQNNPNVVFEMFYRTNPFGGGYVLFTGLHDLIDKLEGFSFSAEDIEYLESLGTFTKEFLAYLSEYRFSGDIYSVEEGMVVFPGEPLLRVHTTMIDASLIEESCLTPSTSKASSQPKLPASVLQLNAGRSSSLATTSPRSRRGAFGKPGGVYRRMSVHQPHLGGKTL